VQILLKHQIPASGDVLTIPQLASIAFEGGVGYPISMVPLGIPHDL